MKNEPSFNSKILLFGEYSIIQDSMGLTLPSDEFQGKLTFDNNEMNSPFISESNEHLVDFSIYLEKLFKNNELTIDFDIVAFKKDIETLDANSKEILEKVMQYMEEKYIALPFKASKKSLLNKKFRP